MISNITHWKRILFLSSNFEYKKFVLCRLPSNLRCLSSQFNTQRCGVTEQKLKCTLIPGDGVGPELVYAVQDIVKATGIPIEFEEIFLSDVHYTRSNSIDEAVNSIQRNNHVALKGVIQQDLYSETEGINMQLRKKLDLFANIVHIKSLKGIKTRHSKDLDFIIVREQTEGEYSRNEHELVPGVIE